MVDGIEVTYFPVRWPRSYFFSPALGSAIREKIATCDVVYAAWLYVYPTAVAARQCRRQGVPYIISPRGMLDRDAIARKGRLKKSLYLAGVERANLRGAQAIHFTSRGERESAVERFPDARSIVIPNGVETAPAALCDPDAELSSLGVPSGRQLVLFLGRLNYIKGLDLLSEAWPHVMRSVPTAHLVLAGPDDDNLYEGMRREFSQRNLLHCVSYVGMVHGTAKACLLQQCALLVSPSYLESFGMSIVEAMAQSKPVVVTDRVNISPDIAAAGAGVVTTCSAAEIASAIVRVINDPQAAASMGRAGRVLVLEQYSLAHSARRMRDALTAAANAGSARQ
jgi:glycosyltransferase involved in cell wall biosynthesis